MQILGCRYSFFNEGIQNLKILGFVIFVDDDDNNLAGGGIIRAAQSRNQANSSRETGEESSRPRI